MIFINLEYLNDDFKLVKGDIEIEDGKFVKVCDKINYTDSDMVVDCEGFKAIPGFIDIHIHGSVFSDASDGIADGVQQMADFLFTKGVTSFCPTTMAMSTEEIENALLSIKKAKETQTSGASIVGINLEGPFFNKAKKGAQLESAIVDPNFEQFKKFYDLSGGLIKLVDIAPERPGSMELIKKAKEFCTVSMAHSTADYDIVKYAFESGITHATHMFNAMTPLHHRNPGAITAIMLTDTVNAEIICDGKHIHPAVVKAMFKFMGDRLIVISDAMRLSGCKDGDEGKLGGQDVTVTKGVATLTDGTIAGSISNLYDEFINLLNWGIDFEVAAKACSLTPAKAIKMDNEIGSIKTGKKADFIILDNENNISAVYH
ncbi:MAG: N-acetylglucosamine-6-phosphate deacetylase [Clostridia bacterium]